MRCAWLAPNKSFFYGTFFPLLGVIVSRGISVDCFFEKGHPVVVSPSTYILFPRYVLALLASLQDIGRIVCPHCRISRHLLHVFPREVTPVAVSLSPDIPYIFSYLASPAFLQDTNRTVPPIILYCGALSSFVSLRCNTHSLSRCWITYYYLFSNPAAAAALKDTIRIAGQRYPHRVVSSSIAEWRSASGCRTAVFRFRLSGQRDTRKYISVYETNGRRGPYMWKMRSVDREDMKWEFGLAGVREVCRDDRKFPELLPTCYGSALWTASSALPGHSADCCDRSPCASYFVVLGSS